jgi:hypothetical protein
MNIFKQKSPGLFTAPLIATTLALVACGGGGSSGSSSDNASTPSGGVDTVQNLADLKIKQTNELRAVNELSVEIQMTADRSFLSICPDPGEEMAVNSLDYDGCMIRSPLDASTSNFTVALPNHVDRLVAIVWFYETDKAPMIQRWQRDPGMGYATGTIWRIDEAG